jgi:enoyl-[acyl-carrier-protein] reductase (NADH)
MIMKGKKGVILGVANNKSIAYGIAKACAVLSLEVLIMCILVMLVNQKRLKL